MSNELKIAISGKSGCGNTTVSRLLAKRLSLRLINYTFHDMARERGISFEELCRRAETDNHYDLHLDRHQVELASLESCVLASRLAIWLLKEAQLKVYLYASPEVRAGRIAGRENQPLAQALEELRVRDDRDHQRYLRLYGIDIDDYHFADLVVNTEELSVEQVVDSVEEALGGEHPSLS
jgi:cytidylate kinase